MADSSFNQYKKCASVSFRVLFVVAIILTAVLVSINHTAEAPKEIMEFSYKRDANTTEDMMSDPNTNIVQYHITNNRMEAWVIHDFDRGLQVMKVRMSVGSECYVTPLNRTMAKEPSQMTMPSAKELAGLQVMKVRMSVGSEFYVTPLNWTMAKEPSQMTMPSAKELANVTITVMSYELTPLSIRSPILELGFVSESARDACTGVSTYWIFQSSADAGDAPSEGRAKRFIADAALGVGALTLVLGTVSVGYQIASYHRRC